MTNPMKVLIFNRSFYPDFESTGQLLTELCEDLVLEGYDVTVICGRPYFVSSKPSKLFNNECYKGIKIIRAFGTTLLKENLIYRILNLLSYFISSFIAGHFVKEKPDIVITQSDPPVSGFLGLYFSRLYKSKFVYYPQDFFYEMALVNKKIKNSFLLWILKSSENLFLKKSDKIICIGNSVKKTILSEGVSDLKINVIHNWVDTSLLYPIKKDQNSFIVNNNLTGKFIVMYSGNLGYKEDLEIILDTARCFTKSENVKFVILGGGARKNELINKVNSENISNILFLPYQEKKDLKYSLSAADLHIIATKKELSSIIVPSKIYGIMASGRPFLSWMKKDSEIGEIVTNYKCGINLDPVSLELIIEKIKWCQKNPDVLDAMGNNGRVAAEECFDRKIATRKISESLNS